MEVITYKTNIRSLGALNRVRPHLNRAVGSANWQININSADRQLQVYSPGIVNEPQVMDAIIKAGFNAVKIEDYVSTY